MNLMGEEENKEENKYFLHGGRHYPIHARKAKPIFFVVWMQASQESLSVFRVPTLYSQQKALTYVQTHGVIVAHI